MSYAFNCELCKFTTNQIMKYNRHLNTMKHKNNSYIFNCVKCDYHCNNKTNFNRHLTTVKHYNTMNKSKLICSICNKKYMNRYSFYAHKKSNKCSERFKIIHSLYIGLIKYSLILSHPI